MDPTNQLIDVLARSYLSPKDLDALSTNISVFPSPELVNGTGSQSDPRILVEKAPLRTCPAISVFSHSHAHQSHLADRDCLRCASLTTRRRMLSHTTIMTILALSILPLDRTRSCPSILVVNL